MTDAVPKGYHSVTPYIIVRDAPSAIQFYERAFGADEHLRLEGPEGVVAHAEIQIGDSIIMLAEENPTWNAKCPLSYGGSAVSLLIYTHDADAMYAQAIDAGATPVRPVQDQFYGDRSGVVMDPFGHSWSIATHKEDLTQSEVQARFEMLCAEIADADSSTESTA